MTTTVTKTVKSAAGDYSTLSGWESGQQANIVAADQIQEAACYSFALTDNVAISGWTTDATRYTRIYTPPGERHNGTSRDVSGVGFRIADSFAGAIIRYGAHDYGRIEGLNIKNTSTASGAVPLSWTTGSFTASTNSHLVDACILQSACTDTATYNIQAAVNALIMKMQNTILYGGAARGWDSRNAAACTVYFCNLQGNGSTSPYGFVHDGELAIFNSWAGGYVTECFYTGGVAGTGTNNAATDVSATVDYTASINSLTASSQFTNLTGGSEDFSLKAGNALAGAGVAAGSVTVDIKGTTRPQGAAYDIGAFETVLGASAGEIIAAMTSQPSNQNLRPRVIGY